MERQGSTKPSDIGSNPIRSTKAALMVSNLGKSKKNQTMAVFEFRAESPY